MISNLSTTSRIKVSNLDLDKDDIYFKLEDLSIEPKKDSQEFISEKYGYKTVKVKGEENLKPENIKGGISIFNVEGSFFASDSRESTATNKDILIGKTAHVNNQEVIGNMPNNGELIYTPGDNSLSIPLGYTDGGYIESVNISNLSEYQNCLSLARNIVTEDRPTPITEDLFYYYKGNSFIDHSGNNRNGSIIGAVSPSNNSVIFNGGYGLTGPVNRSKGSFEIYCTVDKNFSCLDYNENANVWHRCSCIFGCELSAAVQDFGIVIYEDYYALGYSMHAIYETDVKANDGLPHHIVLTNEDDRMRLYIDGKLKVDVSYTMQGETPSKYGIFWNNCYTNTKVKGEIFTLRYYPNGLTEEQIINNYNCCKLSIF